MIDFPSSGEPNGGENGAESPADGTLGGYVEFHHRPPGFQGSDGYPYTVSLEVAKTPDLPVPFSGFLVFPRWADTGVGIIGHLETPMLRGGGSRDEVESALGAITLQEVHDLLEEAIRARQDENEVHDLLEEAIRARQDENE
jgi:hypothetical protein